MSAYRYSTFLLAIVQIVVNFVVIITWVSGLGEFVVDGNVLLISRKTCLFGLILGVILLFGVLQESETKCRMWLVAHCIFLLLEIIVTVSDHASLRRDTIFKIVGGVEISCALLYVVNAYLE
ncbi:uncharacterized protein LOC118438050 [Folsomia candida]|uniref:uncharacterized protein LOC118438050 n=1 Tax=Folsomia candida TaxID=158441 RepID=UPI001604FE41|nr:uncharacterized protein LOC118438050 [Folsomia candida]